MDVLPFNTSCVAAEDLEIGHLDSSTAKRIQLLYNVTSGWERRLLVRLAEASKMKCGYVLMWTISFYFNDKLAPDAPMPDCDQCHTLNCLAEAIVQKQTIDFPTLDDTHKALYNEIHYVLKNINKNQPLRMDILTKIYTLQGIHPLRHMTFIHEAREALDNPRYDAIRPVIKKFILKPRMDEPHERQIINLAQRWMDTRFGVLSREEQLKEFKKRDKDRLHAYLNGLKYALEHDSFEFMEKFADRIHSLTHEYHRKYAPPPRPLPRQQSFPFIRPLNTPIRSFVE